MSKLTVGDVLAMREARARYMTYEDIAKLFKISPSHACRICTGKSHRGIGGYIEKVGVKRRSRAIIRTPTIPNTTIHIIRSMRANGATYKRIHEVTGVSISYVGKVCKGEVRKL